jgi:ATP-dependent exoDNAse (exonuclease V) alpha subunit
MQNIKHTEAFDLAYRFVTETDLTIFLTGKAGTGKTTFLKYLRETSPKKMVVAAPTGVAAINAGGVTLHSLFQLPFAPFVPSKDVHANGVDSHSLLSQIRYNKEKLILFRTLELLVIDEASMVASHTVDAIDTLLRSVRRRQEVPFGGVQMLFIGDLHQLPPVVRNTEWEFLKNYYPSVFFFDSIVLRENVPVMIELKEIFRQHDDVFIRLLNEIRHNSLSEESLNLLNSRIKKNFATGEEENYITLTTHNAQADELNKKKLKALSSPSQFFHAEVYENFPENAYPAEASLQLKEGAQVMFLKNDMEGKKYFNGKIGVVTELGDEKIKVQCKGEDRPIEVKRHEWKNMNYSLNPDTREIREEELGSFFSISTATCLGNHDSQKPGAHL